jgi:hypothetical protein
MCRVSTGWLSEAVPRPPRTLTGMDPHLFKEPVQCNQLRSLDDGKGVAGDAADRWLVSSSQVAVG